MGELQQEVVTEDNVSEVSFKMQNIVLAELEDIGMSQTDLAEAIGSSPSALNRSLRSLFLQRRALWWKIFDYLGYEVTISVRKK